MAQEHRSGQIVPESGVYRVTHASAHTGVLLQVRLIKAAAFQSVRIARKSASNWRIRTKHFGEVDQRPGPNIAGTVGQRGANRATKRWSLDPAQLSAASDRPVARLSLRRSRLSFVGCWRFGDDATICWDHGAGLPIAVRSAPASFG